VILKPLFKLTKMEFKLFFRDYSYVFWTFLFPVLMFLLLGSIFERFAVFGKSYSKIYIPSWICVNALTISLFTIGVTLSSYREQGILKRYKATPLKSWVVLAAQFLTGSIIFLLSSFFLIFVGFSFYDLKFPSYFLSTLFAIFLILASLFPFGLFLTSFAKNARQASAIGSVVLNFMLFLSGATIPLKFMPPFLQALAKIIPLYYAVDLLRSTWSFAPLLQKWVDVIALFVFFIVFSLLAIRKFKVNF